MWAGIDRALDQSGCFGGSRGQVSRVSSCLSSRLVGYWGWWIAAQRPGKLFQGVGAGRDRPFDIGGGFSGGGGQIVRVGPYDLRGLADPGGRRETFQCPGEILQAMGAGCDRPFDNGGDFGGSRRKIIGADMDNCKRREKSGGDEKCFCGLHIFIGEQARTRVFFHLSMMTQIE